MANQDRDRVIEMLQYILGALVDYPDALQIRQTTTEEGAFIQLYVDKRDMGLIVGRGGSHVEAIKLIAKLVAFKVDVRVSIKLEEPKV